MAEKLTKAQIRVLAFCEDIGGGMYASGAQGLVAYSLVRRGLFSKLVNGPYFVTPAGRAALQSAIPPSDRLADERSARAAPNSTSGDQTNG